MDIRENFTKIKSRYKEVETLLAAPEIMQNLKEYASLNKEYKRLGNIMEQTNRYEENETARKNNAIFLQKESDPELTAMGREERDNLEKESEVIEKELQTLLLPQDPNDDKSVILELRAGTGGDEAALWAGDLFRMYQRFSEAKKWKMEVLSYTEGISGGYKEIICNVVGEQAYSFLKYESGVHRVQRVPSTETQGRIHTSAASVVVLPEMNDVDITLDMSEIKKETFCSSGPGGQSVNTTYSAVRLTHLPTGISASCQDGKSQIKNLEKAMKVLRARLYEKALRAQQEEVGEKRRSMVGGGDRSAKIRTYNFSRSWVNDHRIGYTGHYLTRLLNGELDDLIDALRIAENTQKLESGKAL